MEPITSAYLCQIITRCTQSELQQISLPEIKKAFTSLGLKPGNKRKDELINEIVQFLSSILLRQYGPGLVREGFPLFNLNNELFQRDVHIRNLIEQSNQQIHMANIQLAQYNQHSYTHMQRPRQIATPLHRCFCNNQIDPNFFNDSMLRCINAKCGKVFHKFCMKVKNDKEDYPLFECPECVLSKSDPLHEIRRVLIAPFIADSNRHDFIIDESAASELKSKDNIGVEVRCIRLEEKSHEQTWPHMGELIINQYRYLEFKPLQQNSSLKKRKDEKFFTREPKAGMNHFWLKYVPKSDPRNSRAEETYVVGVYLVRKLTPEELVKKIINENKKSIEDCKKKIVEDFENSPIDIEKLSYPLTCVLDMQPLKTPAKGLHCKHSNCFSLENYISVWQKNNQRKWLCPICKLKCYDIIVDSFWEKILQEAKKQYGAPTISLVDVEILKTCEYKFVKNDDEESDEEAKTEIKETKPEKPNQNIIILDDSDDDAPKKTTPKPTTNPNPTTTPKPSIIEQTTPQPMIIEKPTEQPNKKDQPTPELRPQPEPKQTISDINKDRSFIISEDSNSTPVKKSLNKQSEMILHDLNLAIEAATATPSKATKDIEIVEHSKPQPQQQAQTQAQIQNQSQSLNQPQNQTQNQAQAQASLQSQTPNPLLSPFLSGLSKTAPNPLHPTLPSSPDLTKLMQMSVNPLAAGYQNPTFYNPLLNPKTNPLANYANPALRMKVTQSMNERASLGDLGPYLMGAEQYPSQIMNLMGRGPLGDYGLSSSGLHTPGLELLDYNLMINNPRNPYYQHQLLQQHYQNQMIKQQQQQIQQQQHLHQQQQQLQQNLAAQQSQSTFNPLANLQASKEQSLAAANHESVALGKETDQKEKDNSNAIFTIEKDKPSKRLTSDSERNIDKMVALTDYKLELPTFDNYKSKKYQEIKKYRDTDFQKNKKLVTLAMKQIPLQTKTIPKSLVAPNAMPGPTNGKTVDGSGVLSDKEKNGKSSKDGGSDMSAEDALKTKPKPNEVICLD